MKKIYISALLFAAGMASVSAQTFNTNIEIPMDFNPTTVQYPPSPLKSQKLFIGGKDMVQHTAVYGNAAGAAIAKEQNDFIGFTPATQAEIAAWAVKGHQNFLGWLSINHEDINTNDKLGDGGGMTVFAIKRDATTDSIIVVPQTLNDGRTGLYFNVDFANTVGETGMNCGGIASTIDGRIWTAEEWFRNNANDVAGFRHGEFTIDTNEFAGSDYKDKKLSKIEALNWMVEIDPRQAKAIRKQYNWGRAGWEGGAIAPDNKTVYLGEDDTPGRFVKFVADVAGDFTKGKTYVYKYDTSTRWVEIDNMMLDNMVNFKAKTIQAGMTMFNRLEWVQVDQVTGMVYMAETGNDNVNTSGTTRYLQAMAQGPCKVAPHFAKAYKDRYKAMHGTDFMGTDAAAIDSVTNGKFRDYYGRVLQYNPTTHEVTTLMEGGPYFATSPTISNYPAKHFTNPDGLGMLYVNGKTFLIINEDINGRTFGRMPAENSSSARGQCETYILDLSIQNPTLNDMVRITASTLGAEIYGVSSTPDGKTIFVNNQHPDKALNTGDYAFALTYAITGWDKVVKMITTSLEEVAVSENLKMWPNPVARELNFSKAIDIAIYDGEGKRVKVSRNSTTVDVQDLIKGTYFVRTIEGQTLKLVVQ
jgi:secreted PhoX family phosphatase